MAANCLVVSERSEDLKFGKYLCDLNGFILDSTVSAKGVRDFLLDHWSSILILDGDNPKLAEAALKQLGHEGANPLRVFVITDSSLNRYPYLFTYPFFGHHIHRRFKPPAPQFYSKLLAASLAPHPFGVERYIEGEVTSQKISLTHSKHKVAAVDALQSYFTKQFINRRLSALAAQATDELIMNALFDAPIKSGKPYRRDLDRAAEFELDAKEKVEVQVASNQHYVGICVSDNFGSLEKHALLTYLKMNYHGDQYAPKKDDPSAALGILNAIQSGLSLVFVTKPMVRSDVMLFFPKAKAYKDFKNGFRFLSINAP